MRLIILLLLTHISYAQTWPDSTCPDKPYTKGNDDRIYHTCDCGVKLYCCALNPNDTVTLGHHSITATTFYIGKPYYTSSKKKTVKIEKENVWSWQETHWANGTVTKVLHKDTLYCSLCGKFMPKEHIYDAIKKGFLQDKQDDNGLYLLTEMGKKAKQFIP